MAIRTDENYVYLACYYTPWGDAMNDSGLWRIAKSELVGGAVDGIENVVLGQNANEIYDLSGRRVQKTTKGLYIINGQKVYVK
jgi:hypothetical protein